MEVQLQNISKRYIFDWIIKDLNYLFPEGSVTGVNGINGSGKSTLIKILSGWLSTSKGQVSYTLDGKAVKRDNIYKHVSIVGPYTDVIQEYDLEEMYTFHTKFKKLNGIATFEEFRDVVRLKGHRGKPMQFYSSGMKQRVELAFALLTNTKLLLLDEPTAYLDENNKKWFYDLLKVNMKSKTVIISSNDMEDFTYCTKVLELG